MSFKDEKNSTLSSIQVQALKGAALAKEEFVGFVLREFAEPPIASLLSPADVTASGIEIVYQPVYAKMWVTQHGVKIGPEFSTETNRVI